MNKNKMRLEESVPLLHYFSFFPPPRLSSVIEFKNPVFSAEQGAKLQLDIRGCENTGFSIDLIYDKAEREENYRAKKVRSVIEKYRLGWNKHSSPKEFSRFFANFCPSHFLFLFFSFFGLHYKKTC